MNLFAIAVADRQRSDLVRGLSAAVFLSGGFGALASASRTRCRVPLDDLSGAAMILIGVTAAVWAGRRRCPYLLVGWLWYLGMLVPVIGLVPFGAETSADRFTYLPQIGIGLGSCGGRPICAAVGRIVAGCAASVRRWCWWF